jgi:predicted lipase
MLWRLFEPKYLKEKDILEVRSLRSRFGDEAKRIVRERAENAATERDRKHWQRIARKI